MSALLRAVPPAPAQLAADPEAPHILFFAAERETLALATIALGIGLAFEDSLARLAASRHQLESLAEELDARESALAAPLRRYLWPEPAWRLRTRTLALDRPHVMGILNLTDDSFSGDGVGTGRTAALRHAESLRGAGASLIDVGAETARADRPALEEDEEARVVEPVVAALVREGHAVSVDTYKPFVARAALAAGAEAVNDISGLTLGTGAAEEAWRARAGYVLNYSYSVPKRRPESPPRYRDVVAETVDWVAGRLARLRALGFEDAQLAVDPGIAFGKSHDQDLQVLRRAGELTSSGLPVMLAHSRKNFIGSVSESPPAKRDLETHVATALAYEQGARLFRVHDVEGALRTLTMAAAIVSAAPGDFRPGEDSWPWRAGASATHSTDAVADKAPPPGQRW